LELGRETIKIKRIRRGQCTPNTFTNWLVCKDEAFTKSITIDMVMEAGNGKGGLTIPQTLCIT